jgi:SAM-dependent methyltransferase
VRDWALARLRCLGCDGKDLALAGEAVSCRGCGAAYPISDGIACFLRDVNPIVERERSAVSTIDGPGGEAEARVSVLLRRMDSGEIQASEIVEYACIRHAVDSRRQIQELLAAHPLTSGETVVELGADHCWGSGVFLDAGCRVIAVDITDHLRLAPRASDPALCRVQADMNVLPLRTGSVDVVWATSAAHHSWDLGRTFAEAARVLRPGGRLFFCCEPMPSWLRYPFGTDFGHAEKELGINETWVPRSTWLRLSARAGLRPQLVFPSIDAEAMEARLRSRRLPSALAHVVRPVLPLLQVSIHLVAVKGAPVDSPAALP